MKIESDTVSPQIHAKAKNRAPPKFTPSSNYFFFKFFYFVKK